MKTERLCNQCGKSLPESAADNTCPSCLLEWGLGNPAEAAEAIFEESGEPRSPAPLPTRLTYFGDYELLEEIARGGMGIVYKGRQVSLNRIVAVKVILAGQFASQDARQRFKTEAEAAARLRHPHIVGIHEVGEHEGFHYFSMDYIDGKNLSQLGHAENASPRLAAEWVKTIAEAIHYAHEQGILHRDLKPSNVLIDRLNSPHVTDFGLAKQLHGSSDMTVSGQVLGSPNYMPPEQAEARHVQIGRAGDVYSLGAILYYLLAGRPPFTGQTIAETLHQVVHGEVITPRLLNPNTPEDLATICLKCLEKDPRRRYQTAQELADELGRFLRDEPIRSRPITAPEKAWRWCRRKPVVATLAASLVLMFCLGFASVAWQLRRVQAKSEENRQQVAGLNVLSGAQLMQDGDYFKSLLWFTKALQIDQGNRAHADIHRMRIASVLEQCPKLVQVISHDGQPIAGAAFNSIDDRLATIGADQTARVWEIPSGQELMRTPPFPAVPLSISFSPDGSRLAVTLADSTARILDAQTGHPMFEPLPHRIEGGGDVPIERGGNVPIEALVNVPLNPAFSSTGKKLFTRSKEMELQIWDASTGQPMGKPLVHTNQITFVQFTADGSWLFTRTFTGANFAWDTETGARVGFPGTESDALKRFLLADQSNVALLGDRIWKLTAGRSADALIRGDHRREDQHADEGIRAPKKKLLAEPVGQALEQADYLTWPAFSPSGDRFLATTRDGAARILDVATGQPLTPTLPHFQAVRRGFFSPDGRRVLTISVNNTARVWNADTGEPLTPPINHHTPLALSSRSSSFSGSGRYFVSVHPRHLAYVWDLHREIAPPVLLNPIQETPPAGEVSASAGMNNQIRIHNTVRGDYLALHPMSLKTMPKGSSFDATGRFAILEGEMAKVQIWDAQSGMPMTPQVQSQYTLDKELSQTVKLRSSGLPAEDLIQLAQLLSGSGLDGKGGWTSLNVEQIVSAWKQLSEKYPQLFKSGDLDRMAWHRHEAEASERTCDWAAAVFHLEKLSAAQRDNREFAHRLDYAAKCLTKAKESATSYTQERWAVPPRDPRADAQMVDLTDYYTGTIIDGFFDGRPNFDLPVGLQSFGGVRFDVRGVIQLSSRGAEFRGHHLPETVTGIKIQKRCQQVHFLHAARWGGAAEGTNVATVIVHYAGGQSEKISLQNLVHIASDWSTQPFTPKLADVAWIGTDALANSLQRSVRLFKYTWTNPHPELEVSHVDLVSAKNWPSYTLVAMTLE